MATPIATIPKIITGAEELVVLKRSDFEMFQKWQHEATSALLKVKRGREEYKKKKTVIASSPRRFR